jgi:outer membrane receptor protein involved in Fe transport
MTLKTTKLRDAITFALAVGATAVAGTGIAFAQDATQAAPAQAPADQQAKTLDRIEVTGSRIRRVDAENASPVVTLDRAAIEKTGKLTLGDLIQELPNIAGAPATPAVNNGGGNGASTVDLRGFGAQRTLVLINGRRVVNTGFNPGADVNAIPASAVERIEVLTTGASAVYGSDAIAGVVNFIMRKDFQGVQASVDYGISSRNDGQRTGGSVTFGQTGDKGNIIAGLNYNKQDAVSSGDRDYSKTAVYLTYGSIFAAGGSSRNPNGYIKLPVGNPVRDALGCSTVTKIPGTDGSTTANYRCYAPTDAFNYQAVNLVMTPQERTNAFFLANYQLTDDVNAFAEVYHNKTSANFAIAPLPFDARSDGVNITADNYYNPFGSTCPSCAGNTAPTGFGPDAGLDFRTRFVSLGQRAAFFDTTTDQVILGVEGFLGDTWKWDFALNYAHNAQDNTNNGYVYYAGLADALGASFLDPATGVVTCGTQAAPIPNCTPLNIFNLNDPQTIATLQQYAVNPQFQQTYVQKGFEANASGELFNMPAGAAQLAFGAQWRREYLRSQVEYVAIANAAAQCQISQEACGSPQQGDFTVGELYGELFLPLLKDLPFAKALNVTIGTRFSNYDLYGSTTNSKLQVEWRPFDDLLLRGTVAEVFRAPSIADLYAGPGGNAPVMQDPCVGYGQLDPATGTVDFATHASACGTPTGTDITQLDPTLGIEDSGLSQSTGVVSGANYVGYTLKPESGKSFDWGLVYDPSWLPGLSVSLDYWRLYLNDTITNLDAQIVVNACYADNNSQLCPFIHRTADGQVAYIQQPVVNLGRLDTKGWDLALRYKLANTSWGNWSAGFDGTYIDQWDNDTESGGAVRHLAGHYNGSYGMYARVRARAFLDWSMGDFSVGWRTRYLGPFDLGNADINQGSSADGGCNIVVRPQYCGVEVPYGSYTVHSINASYALPSINSRIEVGVDNVFDKQPPLMYQNNVLNANTDVQSFDTVGRYFWARYTVKF